MTSVVGLLALVCVEGLFLPGEQFTCCGPDDVWEADEGLMVGTNEGGGSLTQVSYCLSNISILRIVTCMIVVFHCNGVKKLKSTQKLLSCYLGFNDSNQEHIIGLISFLLECHKLQCFHSATYGK